jgi:hypothetical protein
MQEITRPSLINTKNHTSTDEIIKYLYRHVDELNYIISDLYSQIEKLKEETNGNGNKKA